MCDPPQLDIYLSRCIQNHCISHHHFAVSEDVPSGKWRWLWHCAAIGGEWRSPGIGGSQGEDVIEASKVETTV
jgi:hypothetical protein